tara:strand:+ start:344 stop:2476 length:2133 start_codon:yes stop_codon:yes gene_type:complete
MTEKDPYESELEKEKKAENERIEEAQDNLTEGKIREQREGEGTLDYRKRIYPDYKKNRLKNQRRVRLPGDDDIQAQGDAKLNPTQDMLAPRTPEEIEAAKTGLEKAKEKIDGSKPERDSDGFLKLVGQGLTVFGEALDTVDKNVLGRIGLGDKNLYTARRGIIDGLSERHVALALLGEFLLPDTLDLVTLGLAYIPKRFLKTPKLIKTWAKSTKAATKADAAGDFSGALLLGGRPRLAQRTVANELGDEVFENLVNANKATQRPAKLPLTTPEKQKAKILAGKGDIFDLNAAVMGKGIEGRPGTPKYTQKLRADVVTKVDEKLVKQLQKKFGGTDTEAALFLQKQQEVLRQVEKAREYLNKEFKLQQFGFAFDDTIEAIAAFEDWMRGLGPARAKAVMGKVKPDITDTELMDFFEKLRIDSGAYDIGHINAAKNIYRRLAGGGGKGANFASNLELEPARNLVTISMDRRRKEVVKLIEKGNRARGSRKDLPIDINRLRGVSANIEEEYLKFIHPDLRNFLENLLPVELHDDFIQSTMEALAEKRKFGIQDFDDYLMEVWDFDYGGFKLLPKQSQKAIRDAFKNQKGMIHPQQQLDMFNQPYTKGWKKTATKENPMGGYRESWVEEVINDYLNNLDEAQQLGLTKTFLDDATARGFGAGVDDAGKLPTRKIGEAIIDEDPVKNVLRKTFTENPIVESRAKGQRGRKKKPKP